MSDSSLIQRVVDNLPALMGRVRNLEVRESGDASIEGYWHEYLLTALSDATGASGAIVTAPTANLLGGWQLDNVNENVFYIAHIESNWNEISNPVLEVVWEQNVAGVNPGDSVDLKVIFRYKGDQEAAIRTQTVQVSKIVNAAAQFTQWTTDFPLDYDIGGGNDVVIGDSVSMELNLETAKSEVADIVVNLAKFKYQALTPTALI